ncbi:hypothetical protein [Mesorhizobium sp.]|uniref:hypothetical protein n=1 Tax=Mesorhizobium sp. TaxID=1871066 RepID=UPI000FE2DBAA|nr:hypothetical protein [Mesorhizobium sp.]RWH72459.1 MAG: hypothetical protein EOQ84_09415 [Mesorhizobium sp.]RWL34657.1 MAG: hypothetical protein EOR58_02590 [Mesorhizobium sp.]RWL36070.1 MAG: hypothetical protein EOR63_05170 [Mesorhizobium sp.]RWL41481.1 MAG: hypothetical protein EOR59_02595 [Mesorhizobium sp.]RWL50639.1 MAG: hypothetical protein EOR62_23755 [Mesorhizobium sp.]
MTSRPASPYERLAVVLSDEFNDREVGFTGLLTGSAAALFGTAIPLVAMQLAKLRHAPRLTILLAGCYHNPDFRELDCLPDSEHSAQLRDLPCEAQMLGYPGPWALKRGDVSFGFSSGVQVDQAGNLNSVCIGPHDRPMVRLVGPILQPEHMSMFGREFIMMPSHEPRNIVGQVDFISGVGYPGGLEGRRGLGLRRGGPELIVTPKCIFEFDKVLGHARVRSIHPNVTASELRAATGFDLGDLSKVPATRDPDDVELQLIRQVIDPRGILLPH